MNTQLQTLTIANTLIRTDAEGRYCLNDLHKAAGEYAKDKPANWLQLKDIRALADEVQLTSGIPEIKPLDVKVGRYGGTYACKELVYAYAMWISPKFHLEVIRAYDRLATDGVAVHKNAAEDLLSNPLKYLEAIMGQAKVLAEQNARLS